MRKSFLVKMLALLILLSPTAVLAGSFRAVPIRINMSVRSKTAVLKVTNDGAEKVTVQISAKEWSQDEKGRDVYADTEDIIFFPRMADIKKGEERIIRLGYKGKPSAGEKTYRLFVEELPVTEPGEEMSLKFALRLSIPIFVNPLKEIRKSSIEGAELKEGRVFVRVENSGNTHFVVKKVKARGLDASGAEVFKKDMGGWYVLSGVTRTYALVVPEKECARSSAIKVSVMVGKKEMKKDLSVARAACKAPKKPEKEKASSKKGLK